MGVISYGTVGNPYTTDAYPVDGVGGQLAGVAAKDTYLKDLVTGWLYRNTGTQASPAWTRTLSPDDRDSRVYFRDEFDGAEDFYTLDVPLYGSTGANIIPTTGTARGFVTIPRSGYLTFAEFASEDALAAHASNFITFTVTNRLASGSGSAELLPTPSIHNTTESGASGVSIGAKKARPLDCSGSNSQVNAGDVIEITATVSGTISAMDCPIVKLRIQTVSRKWTPRVSRIAGSPTVVNNSTMAGLSTVTNGNAYFSLSGTNEAQYVGIDWGMRMPFTGTNQPIFETKVFFGTNPATNSRICCGFMTSIGEVFISTDANALEQAVSRYTYDPTLEHYVWFKLNASMALTYEWKSGTGSSLANSTDFTLATSTWYTLTVDMRDLTAVRWFVNGQLVGTASTTGLTGSFGPTLFIQKDSGTNAPTMRADYVDVSWNRS